MGIFYSYVSLPEGSRGCHMAKVFKHMAMISFVILFDLLVELGTILPIQGLPGLRRRLWKKSPGSPQKIGLLWACWINLLQGKKGRVALWP